MGADVPDGEIEAILGALGFARERVQAWAPFGGVGMQAAVVASKR